MDSLVEYLEIVRYDNGEMAVKQDAVLKEYALVVNVNEVYSYRLTCTQTSLKAFIVGYLFAESLVHSYDDLQEFVLDETRGVADVRIGGLAVSRLVERGASATAAAAMDNFDSFPKLEDGPRVSARRLLETPGYGKQSQLFVSTGGVHNCTLCNASGVLCFEEDISRHNALDKIIGYAVINKIKLDDCYIFTSGRVPSDMLVKIVRAGIPLTVSKGAPTDSAIRLAKKYNVTLIGFARGSGMNIYSCPQRIVP
jgi:FdhD protein